MFAIRVFEVLFATNFLYNANVQVTVVFLYCKYSFNATFIDLCLQLFEYCIFFTSVSSLKLYSIHIAISGVHNLFTILYHFLSTPMGGPWHISMCATSSRTANLIKSYFIQKNIMYIKIKDHN